MPDAAVPVLPPTTARQSTELAIARRIGDARHQLEVDLAELERRFHQVTHGLDPRTWFASPWVRVGLAVAVGYALGRRRLLRPLVSAAVGTAATTLARHVLAAARR